MVKREFTRHLRNTIDKAVLQSIFKDVKTRLEKRGNKQSEIEPIMQETLSVNRINPFKTQKKKNNKNAVPNVLVTKFNV